MQKALLATLLLAIGGVAVVAAQNAPADLLAAYKAGVAAEKCGLNLDSSTSSQLGDAVQKAEQRSGLAQGDLDALYSKVQSDADADNAGFCAGADKMIKKTIAANK